MDNSAAVAALAALAQPTRLRAISGLLAALPDGMRAGEIARHCDVPHNTMSTHLATLVRASLVTVRPQGRFKKYYADLNRYAALIRFLTRDSCSGSAAASKVILAAVTQHKG